METSSLEGLCVGWGTVKLAQLALKRGTLLRIKEVPPGRRRRVDPVPCTAQVLAPAVCMDGGQLALQLDGPGT